MQRTTYVLLTIILYKFFITFTIIIDSKLIKKNCIYIILKCDKMYIYIHRIEKYGHIGVYADVMIINTVEDS